MSSKSVVVTSNKFPGVCLGDRVIVTSWLQWTVSQSQLLHCQSQLHSPPYARTAMQMPMELKCAIFNSAFSHLCPSVVTVPKFLLTDRYGRIQRKNRGFRFGCLDEWVCRHAIVVIRPWRQWHHCRVTMLWWQCCHHRANDVVLPAVSDRDNSWTEYHFRLHMYLSAINYKFQILLACINILVCSHTSR